MLSRLWTRSLLDFCATGGARSAMARAVARIMLEHGDPSSMASALAGLEDAFAGSEFGRLRRAFARRSRVEFGSRVSEFTTRE